MDILLASSPHADTFGYSMPPPGLLRLGGELQAAGFQVGLEDLAFRLANGDMGLPESNGAEPYPLAERCAQLLLARDRPKVLGLSTMGATLPAALAIAKHYRAARPQTPILLGGPGTTGTDEAILQRFPYIDAIVRGEGEHTLTEWLARKGQDTGWRHIDGVTWRDATGQVRRNPDRPARRDMENVAP